MQRLEVNSSSTNLSWNLMQLDGKLRPQSPKFKTGYSIWSIQGQKRSQQIIICEAYISSTVVCMCVCVCVCVWEREWVSCCGCLTGRCVHAASCWVCLQAGPLWLPESTCAHASPERKPLQVVVSEPLHLPWTEMKRPYHETISVMDYKAGSQTQNAGD